MRGGKSETSPYWLLRALDRIADLEAFVREVADIHRDHAPCAGCERRDDEGRFQPHYDYCAYGATVRARTLLCISA